MAIKIIDEDEIRLTQAEHARYMREWKAAMAYTVDPIPFEAWVRQKLAYKYYDVSP